MQVILVDSWLWCLLSAQVQISHPFFADHGDKNIFAKKKKMTYNGLYIHNSDPTKLDFMQSSKNRSFMEINQ